jgi:drug/metabolite transporter (DMT)-like permease
MSAVYFYFVRHDRFDKKQILGILFGFVGVALVVTLPLIEKHTSMVALSGNILIVGAAIAFMFYGVMSKSISTKLNATPVVLTFYFCLVTLIVSMPFAYAEMVQKGLLGAIQLKHIIAGIYTGVVGTGLFYMVYQYALKISSEVTASLFTYIQPIATILLAVLLLGEKITIPFLIGGVLAVIGARLASKR